MKKSKLNAILKEELEHIPRGYRGSEQNILRAAYNIRRRNLARAENSPAKQSLRAAIAAVKRDNPEFIPEYNKEFFD